MEEELRHLGASQSLHIVSSQCLNAIAWIDAMNLLFMRLMYTYILGVSNEEEVDTPYQKLVIVDLAASFFLSF